MAHVILDNGKQVAVPEGADPEAYRKYRNGLLKPRRKVTKRTGSRKAGRNWRADNVLTGYLQQAEDCGAALAEAAKRANKKGTDSENSENLS